MEKNNKVISRVQDMQDFCYFIEITVCPNHKVKEQFSLIAILQPSGVTRIKASPCLRATCSQKSAVVNANLLEYCNKRRAEINEI